MMSRYDSRPFRGLLGIWQCWTPKPSGDDWAEPRDTCFRWIEGDCSPSLVVDVFNAWQSCKNVPRSAPDPRRNSAVGPEVLAEQALNDGHLAPARLLPKRTL